MLSRFLLVVILGLFTVAYASAEFYKYRDKNGVLHFTDNLGEVPADQRSKIKRYQETPAVKPNPKKKHSSRRKADRSGSIRPASNKNLTPSQRLIQEKDLLEQSYKSLMNEKMALANQFQQLQTPAEVDRHLKLVADLNRRIAKFEKRRYKYQQSAGALSAKIK